jgi:hypothetical protein
VDTQGILISCKCKRELFLAYRNSNNLDLINYYKKYCRILSAVIKEAKKLNYADKINKSLNKNKTIWNILKLESNKIQNSDKAISLNIAGTLVSNYQEIAEEFNKYFLFIAKNIIKQNYFKPHNPNNTTPLHYLLQVFILLFQILI